MAMIIYSKKKTGATARFIRVMDLLFPEQPYDFIQSIKELTRLLRQPVFNPVIMVLICFGRDDLREIMSLRNLLEDMRIIMIVPDMHPDTVSQARALRPKFLCELSSDFIDVAAVLRRMISKLDHPGNENISGNPGRQNNLPQKRNKEM